MSRAMTKSAALAEAVKRWGKQAAVQDNGKKAATTPESRAAAREARAELRGFITKENKKEFKPMMDSLFSAAMSQRYTVGEIGGVGGFRFFRICGQGDTWEEAFTVADKRNGVQAHRR